METLNKKQLAFILGIKVEEARAKMCVAWARSNSIKNDAFYDEKGKVVDSFPERMPIEILAKELNIPDLRIAVDDINQNFLTRPATRKWIMYDYPEKKIKQIAESGKKSNLSIPSTLRSLLRQSDVDAINSSWRTRFPMYSKA